MGHGKGFFFHYFEALAMFKIKICLNDKLAQYDLKNHGEHFLPAFSEPVF